MCFGTIEDQIGQSTCYAIVILPLGMIKLLIGLRSSRDQTHPLFVSFYKVNGSPLRRFVTGRILIEDGSRGRILLAEIIKVAWMAK